MTVLLRFPPSSTRHLLPTYLKHRPGPGNSESCSPTRTKERVLSWKRLCQRIGSEPAIGTKQNSGSLLISSLLFPCPKEEKKNVQRRQPLRFARSPDGNGSSNYGPERTDCQGEGSFFRRACRRTPMMNSLHLLTLCLRGTADDEPHGLLPRFGAVKVLSFSLYLHFLCGSNLRCPERKSQRAGEHVVATTRDDLRPALLLSGRRGLSLRRAERGGQCGVKGIKRALSPAGCMLNRTVLGGVLTRI